MITKSIRIYLLAIVTLIVDCHTRAQSPEQDAELNGLRREYSLCQNDNERLDVLNEIAYKHYSADSTEYYAKMIIDIAQRTNNRYYEAKGLDYMAWANYFFGNYPQACDYTFQALVIADSIGDKGLKANNYYLLGNAYTRMQNQIKANDYFYKALDIYYEHRDSSHICDVLRSVANNNFENSMFDSAEECLLKSLAISNERGDKIGLSIDNYYLGRLEFRKYADHRIAAPDMNILDVADKYLRASLSYANDRGYGYSQLQASRQLTRVMIEKAKYEKKSRRASQLLDTCKALIDDAYRICDMIDSYVDRLDIDQANALYLIQRGEYQKAEHLIDSVCNVISGNREIYNEYMLKFCLARTILYDATGDYKKASHYKSLYHEMYRNAKQGDYIAQTVQNMAQSNYEQKLRERELVYEADSRLHRIITTFVVIVLALTVILSFSLIRSYYRSRRINQELDVKNNALQQQKLEIELQKVNLEQQNLVISAANQEITDGLIYAGAIQRAVMPTNDQMMALFGDSMVIYRPLDVVSGDFYWATRLGRLKLLAVGDCTGHGVPGAILSMLGISSLNDIVSHLNPDDFSACKCLDAMRTIIKKSLRQFGGDDDNHDGIDMVLVAIDYQTMKLHYSGAYRPLIMVRDKKLASFPYDKMPVGTHYRDAQHFTEKVIDIQSGDQFYMYTDGMTDQFGYDENNVMTKFSIVQLNNLLLANCDYPLSKQKTMIENAVDSWRSNTVTGRIYDQTDDALLVGIKI